MQDEFFQFAGAESFVFIGHSDVGTAVSEIRRLPAFCRDFQAWLAFDALLADLGVDDRFDMGGNGLRDIAQGFVADIQPHRFAIRRDAKPQLGLTVLVEHGNQRDQPLLELSQRLFQFDGFSFHHDGDRPG
nr:hypothetical protein [Vandammella animalimorsus]